MARWTDSLVLGIGINDLKYKVKSTKLLKKSNKVWMTMIRRCYSEKYQKTHPTYIGCKVSQEWLTFSNFNNWFLKNYKEGYVLDKDILVKDNRVYSLETCCFVPSRINELIVNKKSKRGLYPIGVYRVKDRYKAQISIYEKHSQVSLGTFDTPIEAFNAYKEAKEKYIKDVAKHYYDKGGINEKIYSALFNYKIEIGD